MVLVEYFDMNDLAPIFHRPIQIAGSIFANWRVMSHFRQVQGAVGL